MRNILQPNFESEVCPICGTSEDKEVVLIPVYGTQEDYNIQAIQFHTKCIENNWMFYKEYGVIIINARK